MSDSILSLADLHAAAPGVLDVIFGADGDFEGAPTASIPVLSRDRWWTVAAFTAVDGLIGGTLLTSADGAWPPDYESVPLSWCDLDLRIPSIAARLAGLCNRAMRFDEMEIDESTAAVFSRAMWGTARGWGWRERHAASLASLTLALAPRIAALGGARD